jgi:hypothetical protein
MPETDRPHRALEKIDRALAMVAALCKPRETEGAREWIMSIPAEPDRDPDLVIADALHAARAALAPEQRGERPLYRQYRRTAIAEMADWHPGFDVAGVSISDADRKAGSPKLGDKIARNPANHDDRWLVAAQYVVANFEAL